MKHVAVIGGSRGLGKAIVQELLDRKYRVTVLGRTRPDNPDVHSFYQVEAATTDWFSLLPAIENDTASPLDLIVFVAGSAVFGKTAQIPESEARECFELNFWACSNAARAAGELWSGRNGRGKFLAVLSIAARRGVPFEAYYAASKAAGALFLECLELEYTGSGIEFLCAFPGTLQTPFRSRAKWFGLAAPELEQGTSAVTVGRAIVGLLEGGRRRRVIGWRERSIDLADRWFPGLYDRLVLRPRVMKHIQLESEK